MRKINKINGISIIPSDDEIIEDFKRAWLNLDSSLIIKHLERSFKYDSQWFFESLDYKGYSQYISEKFNTLKKKKEKFAVRAIKDPYGNGKMLKIVQNNNTVFYRIKNIERKGSESRHVHVLDKHYKFYF